MEASEHNLYCVMRNFTSYFGKNHPEQAERQLIALGLLFDEAVRAPFPHVFLNIFAN
ncbi:hypothetical protein [Labrys sp. 22185]|uniref:hypothetical protein n=1 Tax=Labrys sp. 22185 TaxID=3453888 RepID=UPI003F84F600